jgi:hypothetical protein
VWPTQLDDLGDARPLVLWLHGSVDLRLRTLARAFLTGTGMTFSQWRRLARLQAALPGLSPRPYGW